MVEVDDDAVGCIRIRVGLSLSYRRAWQHQSGVIPWIFSEVLVASLTEEKFLREQFQ
jgi:hypothetical protein